MALWKWPMVGHDGGWLKISIQGGRPSPGGGLTLLEHGDLCRRRSWGADMARGWGKNWTLGKFDHDLTATEPWNHGFLGGIIPTWPYFRLVNYCNLPRDLVLLTLPWMRCSCCGVVLDFGKNWPIFGESEPDVGSARFPEASYRQMSWYRSYTLW